ncbi:MarR family winged helix-turn-helix transcriptional regulator [Brevibacterium renqingii]|uniref:MarR family winged helix-turn-helix transcriptional regulator n=1 Tax=Brevibacterium renqingii TaxID=2776916 RepID=UPI001ADED268|nr:MarR family transcriptional regulator [Brevibacterium renqingii]
MSRSQPPRLIFLLSNAERTVRRWIEARGSASGMTAAKGGVLMYLRRNPAATMSELTSALHASPAGASGLLARMETAGLVARTPDESDQRVTRVSLTDRGSDVAAEARTALDDLNAALNEGFDDEELATVARWLTRAGGIIRTSQEPDST